MAEIITSIGMFLFVGWLVIKLHPHTPDQIEYKRRTLIDKHYRDTFGDE